MAYNKIGKGLGGFIVIYAKIVRFMGSRQSIITIFLITIATVIWGLIHRISINGYWEQANLFYSILAIFESEIILISQKQKDDIDAKENKALRADVQKLLILINGTTESTM